MQVVQPAESLGIFLNERVLKNTPYKKTTDWIQVALGNMARPDNNGKERATRVLADNIIALILLPNSCAM